jgi:type II protein arginine methyltransferase
MPRGISQTAALIESESLADLNRAGPACGFDVSPLNDFATGNYFPVHCELHRHRLLTSPQPVREYCYLGCPEAKVHRVKVRHAGTVHGVLSWFSADFGQAAVSNAPHSGSHWHQAFHPVFEPIHAEEGEELTLLIDDDGYAWVSRR